MLAPFLRRVQQKGIYEERRHHVIIRQTKVQQVNSAHINPIQDDDYELPNSFAELKVAS